MNSATAYSKWASLKYIFTAVILALVFGSMLYTMVSEPGVTFNEKEMKISTLLYGMTQQLSEIRDIKLDETAPMVTNKTNGIGLGAINRGWFDVTNLGNGRLYVHMDKKPFIYITTADSFMIINYKDSERTKKLYDELLAHWKK